MPEINLDDTIAAIATPLGEGGISVLRLSGPDSFKILGKVFQPKTGALQDFASHTIHLGNCSRKVTPKQSSSQSAARAIPIIWNLFASAPRFFESYFRSSYGEFGITRRFTSLFEPRSTVIFTPCVSNLRRYSGSCKAPISTFCHANT